MIINKNIFELVVKKCSYNKWKKRINRVNMEYHLIYKLKETFGINYVIRYCYKLCNYKMYNYRILDDIHFLKHYVNEYIFSKDNDNTGYILPKNYFG